jgi:hypothetical protein
MSIKKIVPGIFISGILIVASINVLAKVSTIRDMKKFDDKVSAAQPLTVVMAYSKPKGIDRDQRKAIREAEQGLRDASKNDVHEAIKTVFGSVNLEKVPHLITEYKLNNDPHKVSLLFFKRGQLVMTETTSIDKETAQENIYTLIMNTFNNHFGNYIKSILTELAKLQKEVEIARAQAPRMVVDPYYNSMWDYAYHGYYRPYRRHYYRPYRGFGFYMNAF